MRRAAIVSPLRICSSGRAWESADRERNKRDTDHLTPYAAREPRLKDGPMKFKIRGEADGQERLGANSRCLKNQPGKINFRHII